MGEQEWVETDVMVSYDPKHHQVIHTQISTGEVIHRFNLKDESRWRRLWRRLKAHFNERQSPL